MIGIIFNKKGYSIVSIAVSLAIAGVLGVVVAQLFKTTVDSYSYAEDRLQAIGTSRVIEDYLREPVNCLRTLNPDGNKKAPALKDIQENFAITISGENQAGDPVELFSVGQNIGNGMKLEKLDLEVVDRMSTDGTVDMLHVDLLVNFDRNKANKPLIVQSIPLFVEVNSGTRVIQSCSTRPDKAVAQTRDPSGFLHDCYAKETQVRAEPGGMASPRIGCDGPKGNSREPFDSNYKLISMACRRSIGGLTENIKASYRGRCEANSGPAIQWCNNNPCYVKIICCKV